MFIILQISFATRAILKVGEYHSGVPQIWLGNVQSRDGSRLIARERKYLVDYNVQYS